MYTQMHTHMHTHTLSLTLLTHLLAHLYAYTRHMHAHTCSYSLSLTHTQSLTITHTSDTCTHERSSTRNIRVCGKIDVRCRRDAFTLFGIEIEVTVHPQCVCTAFKYETFSFLGMTVVQETHSQQTCWIHLGSILIMVLASVQP